MDKLKFKFNKHLLKVSLFLLILSFSLCSCATFGERVIFKSGFSDYTANDTVNKT